ncbi:MAG: SMC family ATPase [Vulcanimicrobiota bacterium]
MKLLSLQLQGFMPYRESQFIDFRDKSIFALVGPTGSGKSSLLDAITFAFFGKTPRWADGRPGRELISQGEKKLTVQVEFQIKDVTYQVSRVVKRGKTQATQEVQLLHQVDGEFKARSTERHTQKGVNEQLVSLLNMDYATFTRTLMLPQGQFDRLLKPDSPKERKDLLIRLAGLEVYDKLQDKLGQKLRPIEDDLKRLEGQLQGLSDLDLSMIGVLQAQLVLVQQQREELALQVAASGRNLQQLQQDLELCHQLRAVTAQLDSLTANEAEMQNLRERLRRSAEVEGQSGHLQHLDQLRQSHTQAQQQVQTGQARLSEAVAQLSQANLTLESARLQAAELPNLEHEQREMQRLQEVIRAFEELVAEQRSLSLEGLQKQLAGLEEELTQSQSQLQQTREKLQDCEQSLSALGETSQSVHWQSALDLRRGLDQAEKQQLEAQKNRDANLQQRDQLQPRLAESEERLHSLQSDHEKACSDLKALEQELAAQVLRAQLRLDCACPVCLQTVPQLPADSGAEPAQLSALSSRLKQFAQEVKEAQKSRDNLHNQLSALELQRPLLEEQLQAAQQRSQEARQEFLRRFEQLLEKADLEARLSQSQKDDKERTVLVQQRRSLSARLTELDTAIQVRQTRRQSLGAQLDEQQQRLQTIDERVRSRKEQLHQDLGLSDQFRATAQSRLERAQAAATRIQQELKRAETRQRDRQSEHDGLLSRLAVHSQQQSELAAQLTELEGQLGQFLAQANLADEGALRALLLTAEEARQLREQVEQHGQQLHTARERQQELAERLGQRRPSPADLAEAQEADQQLRISQDECSQRQGALEEQIRQLQHDLEQQAEVRQQMEAVQHQLKLHKKLGQMLTANGLKAFVANRLLHEILRLASAELERLSGRYQLELAPDGDILVVDNWNAGETRDVRSLSGGETFLASLSLALAMVEYLSQGSPLESLFIDEGFGTLDPETLEAVTLTLESLHEKGRLVGVITHVQELAERLPMQVRVEKGQGASRILT